MTARLDDVLKLAGQYPVFPCRRDKTPATAHGFKDATQEQEQIEQWHRDHPGALWAIPTGQASGIVCIDADTYKANTAAAEFIETHAAWLHGARIHRTGSDGRHYVFAMNGAAVRCQTDAWVGGRQWSGVDVRGDGGYLVWWQLEDDEYILQGGDPPELPAVSLARPKAESSAISMRTYTAEVDLAEVQAALDHLDPAGLSYEQWAEVGMALHSTGWADGLAAWEAWSARDAARFKLGECARKWESFTTGGGVTVRTLFKLAMDAGWRSESRRAGAKGEEIGEDGIALEFAASAEGFLWCEELYTWLVWDGHKWAPDKALAAFDAVRAYARRHVGLKLRANVVAAVERLARSDRRLCVRREELDADPWLLNTPGGPVDLRTGELLAPDPARLLTKAAAATPGGDCPRWRKFLVEVTNGNHELIGYLQRLAGYALTGVVRDHMFAFFHGEGRNGKGTFLKALSGAMGDYAVTLGAETLLETFGDRHPVELAVLSGARLAVADETQGGRPWDEQKIKRLTGGDRISARYMRGNPFEFEPTHKLIVAGNNKPRIRNVDEAMRSRLHLVPFDVVIPPEQRDLDLKRKLVLEWPGILAWAVRGCLRYQAGGLAPPEAVMAASEDYLTEQDDVGTWIEECCERGIALSTPGRVAWDSWRDWCKGRDMRPGRVNDFSDKLARHDIRHTRSKRGKYYEGIFVRPGAADLE